MQCLKAKLQPFDDSIAVQQTTQQGTGLKLHPVTGKPISLRLHIAKTWVWPDSDVNIPATTTSIKRINYSAPLQFNWAGLQFIDPITQAFLDTFRFMTTTCYLDKITLVIQTKEQRHLSSLGDDLNFGSFYASFSSFKEINEFQL